MPTDYPRVLVAIPSPRDLLQFAEATEKIPADKLFCKYMREQRAYDLIREFFLDNPEYTHLAILPDDLIVAPYHWAQLIFDLHEYDFPCLCGVCNVDSTQEKKGMLNVCVDHIQSISRDAAYRSYNFLKEGSAEHTGYMELMNPPIIKVMFAGFPFMFIRRDVVHSIKFKDDYEWNKHTKQSGCCLDSIFCADCHEQDIPIHADLRVRMNHLKIDDNRIEGKMVGLKDPVVYFSRHE